MTAGKTAVAGQYPGPRAQVALAVAAGVDAVDGVRRSGGAPSRGPDGPGDRSADTGAAAATPVTTQYPGGQVIGVKLDPERVMIHVVAERLPLPAVTADVRDAGRRALAAAGDPRPVVVVVDDLDVDALPRRPS